MPDVPDVDHPGGLGHPLPDDCNRTRRNCSNPMKNRLIQETSLDPCGLGEEQGRDRGRKVPWSARV
jgi:hypothetical protein